MTVSVWDKRTGKQLADHCTLKEAAYAMCISYNSLRNYLCHARKKGGDHIRYHFEEHRT